MQKKHIVIFVIISLIFLVTDTGYCNSGSDCMPIQSTLQSFCGTGGTPIIDSLTGYGTRTQANAAVTNNTERDCSKTCCGSTSPLRMAGFFYKYTKYDRGTKPLKMHFKVSYYNNCPDKGCYKVTGAASCSSSSVEGNIIGFSLESCDCYTGESHGMETICGDTDLFEAIRNGSAPGLYVLYAVNHCTIDEAGKDDLCNGISTDGTCTPTDNDMDGVDNDEDYCETPESERNNVDELGCTKQGGGDDDGDNVPNELDKCLTPPGVIVDAFGCQITPDETEDSDNDGVPDQQDNCPGTVGNGADGCQINNNQDQNNDGLPDGDTDNDTPLLTAMNDWLRKINSGIQSVDGSIDGVKDSILNLKTDLGNKVDSLKTKMTDELTEIQDKTEDVKNAIYEMNVRFDSLIAATSDIYDLFGLTKTTLDETKTEIAGLGPRLDTLNTTETANGGKIDGLGTKIDDMASGLGGKIDGVGTKIDGLGTKIDDMASGLGGKIDGVGTKIDGVGTKIDGVGTKIDDMASGLGGKIDGVGTKIDGVGTKIDGLGEKLDGIDEKLDASGVDTSLPDQSNDDINGDLPEDFEAVDLETDFLSDVLDQVLDNNPYTQMITGSELTASGNCSLSTSINILGRSVSLDFSLCDYDLSVFRAMMLMVSTLTAFFIVFRKN